MASISTKRVIQLHTLADDLSSRARVADRAASKAISIGNFKAAAYFATRATRFQRIANAALGRLEVAA